MGGQQNQFNCTAISNEMMGLTQNCDLPPPSKVFMGSDNIVKLSMNRVCNIAGKEDDDKDFGNFGIEGDCDKLKLLKALRSSQTRAREAERKAAILSKESECLSSALLKEAIHLFAYRQQVRLLEFQVSNLQSLRLQKQQRMLRCHAKPGGAVRSFNEDDDGEDRRVASVVALIGVGTLLVYLYLR